MGGRAGRARRAPTFVRNMAGRAGRARRAPAFVRNMAGRAAPDRPTSVQVAPPTSRRPAARHTFTRRRSGDARTRQRRSPSVIRDLAAPETLSRHDHVTVVSRSRILTPSQAAALHPAPLPPEGRNCTEHGRSRGAGPANFRTSKRRRRAPSKTGTGTGTGPTRIRTVRRAGAGTRTARPGHDRGHRSSRTAG